MTEDDTDAAVIITKLQLSGHGEEQATEMGVFGLDLGIGRTFDEDANLNARSKGWRTCQKRSLRRNRSFRHTEDMRSIASWEGWRVLSCRH